MATLENMMMNIDNLDENNPAHMEALIQAISGGAVGPLEGQPAANLPEPVVASEPETKAEEVPVSPAIEDRAPVATKDGKHTIPYSVLEDTRKAREQAEARNTELSKSVEDARARIKELETAKANGEQTQATQAEADDLRELLDGLADEHPKIADVLGALVARVEKAEQAATVAPKAQVADDDGMPPEVRAAIDAVPAIASWEANNAVLFAEAASIDDRLKLKPEWATKSMSDRFNKVVEIMRAEHGDSIMPTGSVAPSAKPAKPAPTVDDVVINTLSDIPGGTPTAQNALQQLESASPSEIANQLSKMESTEDILRFVTR